MASDDGAVKIVDVISCHEIQDIPGVPEFGQFRQHACCEKSPEGIFLHVALADELVDFIKKHDCVIELRELLENLVCRLLNFRWACRNKMTRVYFYVVPFDNVGESAH